jgi:hypothetical protein
MNATPKRSGALLRDAPASRKLLRLPQSNSGVAIAQARWLERLLRLLQRPFGFVFWALERAISKVEDRIANRSAASP